MFIVFSPAPSMEGGRWATLSSCPESDVVRLHRVPKGFQEAPNDMTRPSLYVPFVSSLSIS